MCCEPVNPELFSRMVIQEITRDYQTLRRGDESHQLDGEIILSVHFAEREELSKSGCWSDLCHTMFASHS